MGDDARNGENTFALQDNAALGEMLPVILHEGSANDWSIPYAGAYSSLIIHSDINDLARIFTDYCCDEQTPLKELGITWAFGDRN